MKHGVYCYTGLPEYRKSLLERYPSWKTTNQCLKTANHYPKTIEHRKSQSELSQTPQISPGRPKITANHRKSFLEDCKFPVGIRCR